MLTEAETLLRYATQYIRKHELKEQEEEGILATQMHELVVQKLDRLTK